MTKEEQEAHEMVERCAARIVYQCTSSNNKSLAENHEQFVARLRKEVSELVLSELNLVALLEDRERKK